MRRAGIISLRAGVAVLFALSACRGSRPERVQGYVEGEFVYVASPIAGKLEKLAVQRGQQVRSGDKLFTLESALERAAYEEAAQRLNVSRATLEDLTKGKRPTEIESMDAQLEQARASLVLSEKQAARLEKLAATGAAPEQDFDRARATRDQDRQRVAQLSADLQTAGLPARSDQIAAAEASVHAQEAALARADWDLTQKIQSAGEDAVVFDTLFREGEWILAGRPVVALLPPKNIKVRAFVGESEIGSVHLGDPIQVRADGTTEEVSGKVSYISPRAEFTPPVIYSRESRGKLVFMIEATFAPADAAKLHPGQPLDIELRS